MKRNTPSARLLGHLLMWIRWAGTGASIRSTAKAAGLPPATVAQIEKGQRALKEPKIASLATALDVDSDDLIELWELCQGLVRDSSGRPIFYTSAPDSKPSSSHALRDQTAGTEDDRELDLEFWLAERIRSLMSRLIPHADFEVRPARSCDPIPHAFESSGAPDGQNPSEVPVLWVLWNDPNAPDPVAALELPLITTPSEAGQPKASAVSLRALDELIRSLSGSERERVRGYIEAVLDQRTAS